MPDVQNSSPSGDTAALAPDEGAVIPRIALKEQGYVGLKVRNKQILEETNAAFRYPAFLRTVNEIRYNPTVGAAMNVYRMMISRVQWSVEPPVGATQVEIDRAKIVETMMHDMEGSWGEFIESVVPYLEYGFAINEIVLRRRLKRNGSRHNDGLTGLRKLATRSQDTIVGWKFSEPDGSNLEWVEQSIQNAEDPSRFMNKTDENGRLRIDRDKFLLFSASANKGNPIGNSIYKNIYLAYKQLSLLQDQELLGCAKDIQGILKICIPPKYLDPNGSAEDQAVATAFQGIIDNYNAGTQRGLLVPNMIDADSKLPLFTYDLMESKGGAKHDIEAIIRRLQGDILSALNVDVLKLGADGTGSFSLAESKSSVLALAIDYRLREIAGVLNSHLMRTLYEQNAWDVERLPKFVYGDIEEISLDELGSFLQRVKAVGLLEVDRHLLNRVRKAISIPEKPEDEEPDVESMTLTDDKSRSGDSLNTSSGGMNGTGESVSKKDNSKSNKENAS